MESKINIVRKEIDDSHYYFVNGEFYPGVTSIIEEAAPTSFGLKSFFLNNTPESADEISKVSLALGSKMHDAYEKLLNEVELNLINDYKTTKEKKHILSFAQWFEDFKPTEIQTEQTVASLKYRYAGTLDCLCKRDGETWLIDFKTSAGIYWNYEIQVAAYKQAVLETLGVKVDKIGILRTGTKHKCGYEFKEIIRDFSDFETVYKTYLSLHNGTIPEPPLIDIYPEVLKLNITR